MAAAPTASAAPARPPGRGSSARSWSTTGAATLMGQHRAAGVELIGGELADTRFRIRRRVRSDDPADLGAPLLYAVEVLDPDDDDQDLEPAAAALSKSRQWVLAALRPAVTSRRSSSWATPRSGRSPAQAPHHPARPRRAGSGRAGGWERGRQWPGRYWSPTTPNPGSDSGEDEPGDGGGAGTP
jgi:hypothetical protein